MVGQEKGLRLKQALWFLFWFPAKSAGNIGVYFWLAFYKFRFVLALVLSFLLRAPVF